jgi:hypothetical protein
MTKQETIDWFLEIYESGKKITPEIIDTLAKALRPRSRGRPTNKYSPFVLLALNQICTTETMEQYVHKSESAIIKSINKAKKAGWVVVNTSNYIDDKGNPLPNMKGILSSEPSKQIWVDNGKETYVFTFHLEERNQLIVGHITPF